MRRGGGNGRGGRIMHNMSPRPLMVMAPPITNQTNQLGLQDIDLELELLKRKREIIEQQQQMLRSEYSSENRFNKISHLYEDTHGYYGEGVSGSGFGAGRKRPSVWEHEDVSSPKRFTTGNNVGSKKPYPQFKSPYKNKPNPQPSFQPRGPQPNRSRPKKKPEFNPSKVTKPSASASPPNKLNTYAPAERQKLVTTAVKASAEVNEALVLRADREPSNKLVGRLGLALGYIMKEIKAQFPQYENLFKNPREIKNAVRERIRVALMGKHVGSLDNIVKIYREVYPPETDRDIVMKLVEGDSVNDFVLIEEDDPQQFYIKNLELLMSRKMDEMFSKLYDMYRITPAYKLSPEKKKDFNNSTVKASGPKEASNSTEEASGQSQTPESTVEASSGQTEKPDDTKFKKPVDQSLLNKFISTEMYQELDKLMSAKLPLMLKKITPLILRSMKLDANYRKAVSSIRAEIRKRMGLPEVSQPQTGMEKPNKDSKEENSAVEDNENPKPTFQYQPLPYYVKILGRPSLPKRKAMEQFFEQYKPKSIKKHRSVHNLLFVGFLDKEAFDNILAADGTQIGRFTLSIKVSERAKKTPQSTENNVSTEDDKLINAELDGQITDLLDSIKKSEELDDAKIENDETQEVNEKSVSEIVDKNDEVTKQDTNNTSVNVTEGIDKPNGVPIKDNTNSENITATSEESPENPDKDRAVNETKEKDNDKPETTTQDTSAVPEEKTTKSAANSNKVVANEEKGEKADTNRSDEVKNVAEADNSETIDKEADAEKKDTVGELKSAAKDSGRSTPTRASARIATTPSTIRTRRASRLLSENNS